MRDITIVEVSPRDGLQNEAEILSTDAKVDLITRLVDAGARRIEAVSFAHPKLVPTMADAEAVMARVPRRDDVSYAGLILNRKGLDRAVGAGVDEVNVVVCVSDTFSGRNQNVTADEAMKMAARRRRRRAGRRASSTTITLATAFGCPFEGEVDPARVAEFARRCADSGVQELCLADTVGVGAPGQVTDLTARMRDTVGDAAAALPLPQHPQHRVRQRLRRGRRGRRRARRQRGRHRRLPVRAQGHGQHRHRRPRLHARADGAPDGDRPHDAPAHGRRSSASSSATRCPRLLPRAGAFP